MNQEYRNTLLADAAAILASPRPLLELNGKINLNHLSLNRTKQKVIKNSRIIRIEEILKLL